MLVLIDGDLFRYRCAFAAERNHYLVELTNPNGHKEYRRFEGKREADKWAASACAGTVGASSIIWIRKEVQPVEFALQATKTSIEATLEAIKSKFGDKLNVEIFLSGKDNFRDKVAVTKPYKGNREQAKPTYYTDVGDYLVGVWDASYTPGMEADDAISIMATEAREVKNPYVVVSYDKDLDQIPGMHYDWVNKEFYEVSSKDAKTRLFVQILAGDSTDNIPGLPGVGEATAAKILAECKSPEEMVDTCWGTYKDKLGTRGPLTEKEDVDYFLEQASLVYIRRKEHEPWIDTKEGRYFVNKYLQAAT